MWVNSACRDEKIWIATYEKFCRQQVFAMSRTKTSMYSNQHPFMRRSACKVVKRTKVIELRSVTTLVPPLLRVIRRSRATIKSSCATGRGLFCIERFKLNVFRIDAQWENGTTFLHPYQQSICIQLIRRLLYTFDGRQTLMALAGWYISNRVWGKDVLIYHILIVQRCVLQDCHGGFCR